MELRFPKSIASDFSYDTEIKDKILQLVSLQKNYSYVLVLKSSWRCTIGKLTEIIKILHVKIFNVEGKKYFNLPLKLLTTFTGTTEPTPSQFPHILYLHKFDISRSPTLCSVFATHRINNSTYVNDVSLRRHLTAIFLICAAHANLKSARHNSSLNSEKLNLNERFHLTKLDY